MITRQLTNKALLVSLLAIGCGDKDEDDTDTGAPADTDTDTDADTDADTDTDTDTDTDPPADGVPMVYEFESRFDGEDSASYSGQIFRHVLINDLKTWIGGITGRIDAGFFPIPGEVTAELDFYFSFDSATAGSLPHLVTTTPDPVQATYDDISNNKSIVEKIAGNDPVGQHVDWTTGFVGWPEPGVTTPESLVLVWFANIDAAAVARSNGNIPLGPDGLPLPAVYLDAQGRDYQQLIQKFLLGSVAFSQGADDYLDDSEPGKGLLSPHATAEDGKNYSALEHAWDEGFGWFGAARDYPTWDDATIASPNYADTWDADGAIDLVGEFSWGHSQNAAKRDVGAVVATDLTWDAWEGFVLGRKLLAETTDELTDAQLDELKGHRDQAVLAWEQAIAATVVHYINDVLQDMGDFGTASYSFADHAKHWSEGKGFALSFQFNPRSPMSDADFAQLHTLLGTAPVLPTAGQAQIDAYAADLIAARALIGAAYGFDSANLGDDNGEGGW